MCSKLQANYKLFKHNHKIPKECKQNINIKISQSCLNDCNKIYYTDQMMIDDWFKSEHLCIDDKLLHIWFDENVCTIFNNIESGKQTLLELLDMSNVIDKKIVKYTNALVSVIPFDSINMKILNAPKRRLKFYIDIVQNWVNLQTQGEYELTNTKKWCVCCGLEYDSSMMNNKYYCGHIEPWSLMQMTLNDNICCCFCIKRVHNMVHYQQNRIPANWNSLTIFNKTCYWLFNYNNHDDKWFVCWYDFSHEMWRYGLILKVLNTNSLKLKIQVSDVDLFEAQGTTIISLNECLPYSYFIYFQCTNYKMEFVDDNFMIATNDNHKMDWLHSKHIYDDKWQIPITLADGTTMHVAFWQIRNSNQLYKYLLKNRKL